MFERITDADINERSMANVSTTPGRRTAFGEGGLDAKALKLRFDRLGRYLAKRLNEVFDGIADGSLAEVLYIDSQGKKRSLKDFVDSLLTGQVESIKIQTSDGVITLTELGDRTQEMYNGLDTGELAGKIKIIEGVTLKKFYEDFLKLENNIAPVKSVNGKIGEVELSAEDVGARPDTWMPTAQQVGADPSGSAATAVSGHNVQTDAHNDIRLELQRLAGIIADLLDSDDATLDELHEIVAYIKSNKALIEAITTSKVNVADIIDNLTTNVNDKPLSAAQGVALKALIDACVNSSAGSVKGTWVLYDWYEDNADLEFTFKSYDAGDIERQFNRIRIEAYDGDSTVTYYTIEGKAFLVCDTSDSVWTNPNSRNITIEREPTTEVSNWIKASAKRYEPVGVDKVKGIDTWTTGVYNLSAEDGIIWGEGFAFYDRNDDTISNGYINHRIPLVAGKNVEFEVDGEYVKINATGGSGDTEQTITGTWVLNEEIDPLPNGTYDLNFSSDGEDYQGLIFGNLGPPILVMRYIAATGSNTKIAYAFTDVAFSGGTPHWQTEVQRILNIKEEPNSIVADWIRANGKKQGGSNSGSAFEMPQIRFANFQDTNGTMCLSEDNPFKFTVEIVGGGDLQEGDLLQICVRRKYFYKDRPEKWKLRRVLQRKITSEDIGKRFLTINVNLDDVETGKNWLFRNDRVKFLGGIIDTLSYMYFRIKRVTKTNDDGEECDAIFSNVEKVAKTYRPSSNKLSIK